MITRNYDFVFWIYDLNIHFTGFIYELKKSKSILIVCEKNINEERLNQGFNLAQITDDIYIIKSNGEIKNILDENILSIHVFYGLLSFNIPKKAFKYAIKKKLKIGIFQESGISWGYRKFFTPIKYLYCKYRYEKFIDFILPMGYLGIDWFLKNKFSNKKLYPFLYSPVLPKQTITWTPSSTINIAIIAQLIRRKNIKLALQSLSKLNDNNWHLKIIGDGKQRSKIEQAITKLNIGPKVTLLGVVPNEKIYEILNETDFTILPSFWDGWGAVINESMCMGVPVICSNKCGGACLIDSKLNRGEVFDLNDKASLAFILLKWIRKGKNNIENREKISNWTINIQNEAVANYFLKVIHSVYSDNYNNKPVHPWNY